MLQSIDTLIAFVVIMTVASLFVTITVQMFSSALSLRGKNLANALALTFQTIDPKIGDAAHQLAAEILSDPLLSDSTRTAKDKGLAASAVEFWEQKCPWHFTDIFGAMRLASAVRPEEVYAALKRLAVAADDTTGRATGPRRKADERLRIAANSVLDALVVAPEEAATIRQQLGKFAEIADEIVDPAVKEKLLAAVGDTPAHLMVEADAARAKFDSWFSTAQDRAQQWFRLHTRGLTIAASFLVALILQLDAVEIFHFVSTNAAGRAALVASADKVIREGDAALDQKGNLIARIADEWRKADSDSSAIDLTSVTNVAQLRDRLSTRPNFDSSKFEQIVATTTRAYYAEQRDRIADLTSGVSATGFEFIPVGYWRWPTADGHGSSAKNIVRHLPGMALFAALLTLGAPYWYNLLKNLASLRPAVAQTIAEETEEERAKAKA